MTGIIIVDKPRDFTSFDVVAVMRGLLHTKKVGHSGTLDPMATGVLPIFAGGATKAVDIVPNSDKSYRAGFALGYKSDTLDIWGNVTGSGAAAVSEEKLEKALEKFRGDIMQIPPMYSALKVGGQKLCDLARKGIEVERKPRPIRIARLERVEFDGQKGVIEVDCSSGTYIRSLIDDIGAELGTGAVMTSLVRTGACGFGLSQSIPLDTLRGLSYDELCERILPVESVFSGLARIELDETQKRLYLNGVRLDADRLSSKPPENELCAVYGGEFLGVARVIGGELVSVKRFS